MNNQFSQKVSDIIVYSKEEANRLRSSYIGPEHLLLGMLRDGEGKAIEILSKLKTNLTDIKKQIEAILKEHADDMLLPDADVPLSNGAAKILKLCILEARVMKSQVADTEHVLLAILKDKDNLAATVLEANHVDYQQVFEQLSLQPDISAGMGFTEDDDDEDEMNQSRSAHGAGEHQQQAQTASRKPTNDTPVLDNFGTDMTKAAEVETLVTEARKAFGDEVNVLVNVVSVQAKNTLREHVFVVSLFKFNRLKDQGANFVRKLFGLKVRVFVHDSKEKVNTKGKVKIFVTSNPVQK